MKIKNSFFGISILVLIAISVFTGSCQWVTIELPPAEAVDIPVDEAISFKSTIEPYFSSDQCLGCHSGASASAGLDLTANNSYKSITKNGLAGGRVDTINPAQSLIYTYPAKHSHPYKSNHKDYVLKWIEQGAKNN